MKYKIYIYGTGRSAEEFYLNRIKEDVTVLGFLDSDSDKWGNEVPFADQYSIANIADVKDDFDYIIVASIYADILSILIKNKIKINKIIFLIEAAFNEIVNNLYSNRFDILKELLKPECMEGISKIINIAPPGNFASPINNLNYIVEREEKIFVKEISSNSGIDMNWKELIDTYHSFCRAGNLICFPVSPNKEYRYYGENPMFPIAQAQILSHIMMKYNTKRIIEAGSGFSSACMLDINDKLFHKSIHFKFIEPYADRLKKLLRKDEDIQLLEKDLQEVDLKVFDELQTGDILFIDSSHVSKIGSDVNYILFEILPNLKEGVIIHFHDIFYPFEYPAKWVYEGRAWNEIYILRAFLQFNDEFKIIFWDGAIKNHLSDLDSWEKTDNKDLIENGSIYLQKMK